MLPLESLHGAFQSSLMVSMVAFRSTIEARKRIWDEICNFSVVTEPGKTAFARSRKTYGQNRWFTRWRRDWDSASKHGLTC